MTNRADSVWIVRKPRPNAKLRLFCFPYAGGGASAYRAFPDALPHLEICAIQPPGRESRIREPAIDRLEPLVDALVPAIRPLLDQPFAFFGYSLGSFVSFEVTRRLRREGAPLPAHLFLAACPAPDHHAVDEPIHDYPEPQLKDELRRYQGTPAEVLEHEELMQLLLPMIRADFAVFETYTYTKEAPLDIPITALGGLQDEDVSREALDGWRAQTTKHFALKMLPGNHFFLHSDRTMLLTAVLQDLAPWLSG